jgi:hypothetical protein
MRITLAAAILVLLVSCSKSEQAMNVSTPSSSDGRVAASSPPPNREAAKSVATDSAAVAGATVASPAARQASVQASPRMIVRTATMSVIVRDAADAMRAIARDAAALGGYVTESRQWREGEQLRGSITVRVPTGRFEDMTGSAKKGAVRVQSEAVTGEDVTQEFSDLSAHLRNAEAAEIELRALMTAAREHAKHATDVLEVYEKLNEVRGQIETIKGRMQYLSTVSAMSTVTVELVPDVVAQPVAQTGWRPTETAYRASRALIEASQYLADRAIWLVIYLLPIALIVGGLFGAFALLVRRAIRTTATHG